MFQKMLLLMPDEMREPIAQQLHYYNPSLDLISISGLDALFALSKAVLRQSRLIAFTSPVIVPAAILADIGYGAYNFHPGPPAYPGLAPAAFAVYQGARTFGGTVHEMAARVDSGAIVGVELCPIDAAASVLDLELRSFSLLAKLFNDLAKELATNPLPLPALPIAWSGVKSSRRTLAAICDITPDIDPVDLNRRLKSFANNHFGVQPTISLHGHRFRLVAEPARTDATGSPGSTANSPDSATAACHFAGVASDLEYARGDEP